jgi:hypothetical protein
MLIARTLFALAAQALFALGYAMQGAVSPWQDSIKWWTVYGTLVDLGCLLLLAVFTRREGLRIRDLIGFHPRRAWKDVLLGLAYFLLIFPVLMMGGTMLSSRIVYGSINPPLYAGTLGMRVLPFWAVIYSRWLWWPLWSVTEETTYQAFALTRLEKLLNHRILAIVLVAFWWTGQHCFFPFIPDWRYVAWRFFAFLPAVLAIILLYSRTRRLPPMIAAHWPMDIAAAWWTLA